MEITTAIPRHGAGGIGRSNSRGGPPWICSSRVGLRKNIRGRRSRSLKLEINEGITGSLSENNGKGHERSDGRDCPCGETHHRGFERFVAHRPVQANHTGADDCDLKKLARRQNHVAVRMTAKHSGQHPARNSEIRCAEKYPGNANRTICRKAGNNTGDGMAGPVFILEEDANYPFDDQIGAVQQSPNHERPGRAVPKSAEKHHDNEIQCHSKWADLISAEWNVEVVAKKRRQRNVPAPPEIRETDRRVRKAEIVFEMEP